MTAIFSAVAFDGAVPLFAIRNEIPADVPSREALLDRAMGPGRRLKSSEAIRSGRLAAAGLSFSAVAANGTLLGTVRLWDVSAGTRDGLDVPALLLGPLAVEPDLKGAGIGGALMRHAIASAAALGHAAILLVGDLPYYARFGFSTAATGRLLMPGAFDPARLLALELWPEALASAAGPIVATGRQDGALDDATPTIAAAA